VTILRQALQVESDNRATAERQRIAAVARAEDMQRHMASGMAVSDQASHEVARLRGLVDDEATKRTAIEGALSKLVTAFKQLKGKNKRREEQMAARVRGLQILWSWRLECEKNARRESWDVQRADASSSERLGQQLGEAQDRITHLERQLTDALSDKADMAARVQRLDSDLATETEQRQLVEEELSNIKDSYLRGVKNSVQSIRACRQQYLTPSTDSP